MKKTLKGLAIFAIGALGIVGLSSCDGEEEHTHTLTYESDSTKHRQVCSECDYKTVYEAHVFGDWTVTKEATLDAKGSRKHTCTVCGKEVSEDIAQLTPTLGTTTEEWTAVYAQIPEAWGDDVNIYYWSNGGTLSSDYSVGWPGNDMTLVDETNHIYGYQLPTGVDSVIFNDGSTQTADLSWSPDRNLFVVTDVEGSNSTASYSTYTATNSDPELAKPSKNAALEYTTIYAIVPTDWTVCNIHFWGATSGNTDWPGLSMTQVEGQDGVWMTDQFVVGATGIIFNNKVGDDGVQTDNITYSDGINAYKVTAADDGTISYEAGTYADNTFTAVEVTFEITELYVLGSMNSWAANDSYKLTIADNTATITLALEADAEFKISDSNWSSYATFGYVDTLGDAFTNNEGNIKVATAGTYVITVSDLSGTPTLTITASATE